MTDPDLLFTAKIRNLTENELVVLDQSQKYVSKHRSLQV